MAKFKDPETGEEVLELNEFTFSFTRNCYKDKFGKELVNKDGKYLLKEEDEPKDYSDPDSLPVYASFGSKSADEKRKILSTRSKDQSIQKNRELRDKKEWIDGKGHVKKKPRKIYTGK